MSNFISGIAVSIVLIFLLASCKAKLSPPPAGNWLVFVDGSTAKIPWSFSDDSSEEQFRFWAFSSSDGALNTEELARIVDDGAVENRASPLEFEIEKPATLVLKNVSRIYNGTYKFILVTSESCGQSDVVVLIAVQPTVTISCSSPAIVNEGDNFTCVCTEQGSNPKATVSWYKDSKRIGDQREERQALILSNIERNDNGTYRCEAKSIFSDEESIELIVQYKPTNTTIKIEPETALVGGSVTITCESDGYPEPVITIKKNGTNVVFTSKKHTIYDVKKHDAATYRCVAENELGIDSKSAPLTVKDGYSQLAAKGKNPMVYVVPLAVLSSVCVLVLLLAGIICYARRSGRCFGEQNNPEPPARDQAGQPDVNEYDDPRPSPNESDVSDYELVERSEPNRPVQEISAGSESTTYTSLSPRREPESSVYQSLLC